MWASEVNYPKVSVVIPVRNEEHRISACLEGVLSQSVPVLEIIVIDSGSTDNTKIIAGKYPKVNIIEIDAKDFNHGMTRNLGFKYSRGEYVLFTVGDARAVDNEWISHLLSGFISDDVAGVCGLQVVGHDNDSNPVEWFKPQSKNPNIRCYQYECVSDFEKLTPGEKKECCSWDDVSAMYRRSIMKKIPYQNVVYGEDVYWAIDALHSGYKLVYTPFAKVYHFHHENYNSMLKKTIGVCYLRFVTLGVIPEKVSIYPTVLRAMRIILKEDKVSFSQKISWTIYNYYLTKALFDGVKCFEVARKSIDVGDLDALHEKYCGSPPIPIKKHEV